MGKIENLEKLQKLKESGAISDVEFESEKEKILNKKDNKKIKVVVVVIILIILLICVGFGIYYIVSNILTKTDNTQTSEEGFTQTSSNIQTNGISETSFGNMSSDDENLEEIQQEIIDYFDNDYFSFFVKEVQRYPQVFKNAKIQTSAVVMKVLKSNDSEYEVLAIDMGGLFYEDVYGYGDMEVSELDKESEKQLIVIKGSQLSKRIMRGDVIEVKGRYIDNNSYEIDNKSYVLSTINAINVIQEDYDNKFSFNTIKNVAEYIFGKDIKINEPVANQDYKTSKEIGNFYKVTLDNQSNADFKVFNMYRSFGKIEYNKIHNQLSDNIQKNLFVSANFEHYIVSTYDEGTKHVYIDYYNKNLQKEWDREFDYTSSKAFVSPMDYTTDKMAAVVDNDLYLIDLKTGKNIIEPVMVGEKIRVNMMEDGIILIGDNNKDTIMKLGYDGKVKFKLNADTKIVTIDEAHTQIVNGNMVIRIKGSGDEGYYEKYIVLNNSGTIVESTEDIDISG